MRPSKEIIILVHGFFKNKQDMLYLENGLCDFGCDILSLNLPTTFGSMEDCKKSISLQLYDVVDKYEKINFVAHSMGGLIVRSYIDDVKPTNISSCIFIATPHKGSKLADAANQIPGFSEIFRPIQQLLTQKNIYPIKIDGKIKIGVIAGTKNNLLAGKIFLSNESDGRVEVSSVITDDARELLLLPFGHHEIHHQHQTLMAVKSFLKNGRF